jgi:hypothetical protein
VEKTPAKTAGLEIPQTARDSHFPTAATTTNFLLHFKCLDNRSYGYILKWLDTAAELSGSHLALAPLYGQGQLRFLDSPNAAIPSANETTGSTLEKWGRTTLTFRRLMFISVDTAAAKLQYLAD